MDRGCKQRLMMNVIVTIDAAFLWISVHVL